MRRKCSASIPTRIGKCSHDARLRRCLGSLSVVIMLLTASTSRRWRNCPSCHRLPTSSHIWDVGALLVDRRVPLSRCASIHAWATDWIGLTDVSPAVAATLIASKTSAFRARRRRLVGPRVPRGTAHGERSTGAARAAARH
jgi:hypothetical protein